MLTAKFEVKFDGLKARKKMLSDISRLSVYVGIADSDPDNTRLDGTVKNATLGIIHENGSPARNIPARPVLKPGVAKQIPFIRKRLRSAMLAALDGNRKLYERKLDDLGLKVAQGVKDYMLTADLAPLKHLRKSERKLIASTPKSRRAEKLSEILATRRPLIDTGVLMNAIDSYVVKERANGNT